MPSSSDPVKTLTIQLATGETTLDRTRGANNPLKMTDRDNIFRRVDRKRLRDDIRGLTTIVDDAAARGSDNAVTDAVKHVRADRRQRLARIQRRVKPLAHEQLTRSCS